MVTRDLQLGSQHELIEWLRRGNDGRPGLFLSEKQNALPKARTTFKQGIQTLQLHYSKPPAFKNNKSGDIYRDLH